MYMCKYIYIGKLQSNLEKLLGALQSNLGFQRNLDFPKSVKAILDTAKTLYMVSGKVHLH